LQNKGWTIVIQKGRFSCKDSEDHRVVRRTKDGNIDGGCAFIDEDGAMDITFDNKEVISLPPLTNFMPDVDNGDVDRTDAPLRKPRSTTWGFRPSLKISF